MTASGGCGGEGGREGSRQDEQTNSYCAYTVQYQDRHFSEVEGRGIPGFVLEDPAPGRRLGEGWALPCDDGFGDTELRSVEIFAVRTELRSVEIFAVRGVKPHRAVIARRIAGTEPFDTLLGRVPKAVAEELESVH